MSNINEFITKNFTENIEYIQTNHKELFEKLSALDNAVANSHYKEKYELVYEDDAFDVVEIDTNNRLYNHKSKEHTKLSQESVNNKLNNSLFECFVRQEGKPPIPYVTSVIEKIYQYKTENETITEFGKFIFFGVGLGLHIDAIDKKITAKNYLIVEDDLELFRLSLFCINYKNIAKNANITFAVFEEKETFLQISETFLKEQYYLNHYIKYFQLLSHSEEKYNQFHIAVTSQPHIRFLFHDLLDSHTRPLERFAQGYKILQKSLNFQDKRFTNKPFLFATSGPSLQHNIKWLEENKNHFTIICASSSLHFLEKYNIVPEIVLHIDPFKASVISIEKLQSKDFIKDALIFLNASVHPDFLVKFNKENVYLMEMGSNHKEDSFKLTGPCVGSAGLLLLVLLQIKEVYLLGLDLAIDSKTGKDHTSTHQSTKTLSTTENAFDNQMSYKDNVFEINGNLQEKVLTTPHFYSSVNIINRHYPQLKAPTQTIYNLSNGANYTIAQAKQPQDTKLHNKTKISLYELKEYIEQNTTTYTALDIKKLQTKLKEAENRYNIIKNYTYNPDIDINQYIKHLLKISNVKESDNSINELSQVLNDFYRYILEYIYYFIQQTKNKNAKTEVLKHFKEQTLLLINNYISALKKVTKG